MKPSNISISNNEKISMFISLSTMLSAGITIIEAIDSLLEDSKGNMKKILATLKNDLSQGRRIHTSFAQFPQVFDKVTVNVIKASEEAGTLDVTLKQITETMQKDMEFTDKIKGALVYPIFIVIVFFAVLFMILVVVIPKITTVFLQLKLKLPLPTRILIFFSNIVTKQTIPLLAGLLILGGLIYLLFRFQKKLVVQTFYSLPLVSRLVIQIDLVRFTRNLAMLYKSGIIITSSLELCADIVLNKKVREMIQFTQKNVFAGKRFSESLHVYKKIVPSIMIKIIEAGEKSGSLEESLYQVATFLDYEVSRTLKTFTALLEPVMLVFVGIMVGGMMLSIIAPIYGMIGQVGTR